MPEPLCLDHLDLDADVWFVCDLLADHQGRHRDTRPGINGPHPRGAVVEWDRRTTTVPGEVL